MVRLGRKWGLAAWLVLASLATACGSEGGGGESCGAGEFCPCDTNTDCPSGETCSAIGICIAATDAGDDVGDDVIDDVDSDTAEDVDQPETIDDAVGDTTADADTDTTETDADASDTTDGGDDADIVDVGDDADAADVADTDTGPDEYVYEPVGPIDALLNPWVAFVSRRSGSARIWAVRADGTDLTLIDSGDLQPVSPAWGPDGTKLAYAYATPDGRRVRVLDVTTGEGPTYDVGFQSIATVVWAPDGSALAVEGRLPDSSESDIVIVPLEGGLEPFALITDTGLDEVTPVWTDDGRVYFAQGEEDSFDLMYAVVGVDDAEFSVVDDSILGSFAVSRYGEFFVYVRRFGSASQMVRFDVESETETVIGGATDAEPFLAWDDRILMFVRSSGEPVNPELQLADASSGGVLRVLAADPGSDTQPAVAPVESDTVSLFWSTR